MSERSASEVRRMNGDLLPGPARLFADILDLALRVTGADMADVRAIEQPAGLLSVVAQRGFDEASSRRLAQADPRRSAWRQILAERKRLVVEDLSQNPVFGSDPETLEALLAAGVRAGQATPISSDSGEWLGVLSTFYRSPHRPSEEDLCLLDLLERHAAVLLQHLRFEEAITREQRYGYLIEISPDPILVQVGGQVVLANSACAQLFGARDPCELIGRRCLDLFPPEGHALIHERLEALACGKSVSLADERILRLDGEPRDVEVAATSFSEAERSVILLILRDITARKRMEQELSEAEQRFRALVENVAQAVWEGAPDGRQVAGSESWAAYTGQTMEEMKGYGFLDAFHPDDRALVDWSWRESVTTLRPLDLECRMRKAGGGWRWTNVRASPLLGPDGKVRKWVGMHIDITDRKEAEEALRRSEERLRLAQEGARIGWWDQNLATRELTWSDECWAICGRKPFPGLTYETLEKWFHPEDLPAIEQAFQRSLAEDVPLDIEYRLIWPDGTVHWQTARGRVYRDAEGRPLRLAGMVLDVTARRQAEDALRQSEEKLRLALEAADMGAWEWNLVTGVMVHTDRCKAMFELPPEAEYGFEGFLMMVHPGDRPRVEGEIRRALQDCLPFDLDFPIVTAKGQRRWLALRGQAHRDVQGRTVRMAGMSLDVTRRREAEEALRRSEEKFRLAQEAAGIGAWEWNFLTNRGVQSDRCKDIFGLSHDAELTRELFFRLVHPEDRERTAQAIEQSAHGEPYDVEIRIVTEDGAMRWVAVKGQVYPDESERPVRLLGVVLDITERKRGEEERERLLAELGATLSCMSDGVIVYRNDATIALLNPAAERILGLPRDKWSAPVEERLKLEGFTDLDGSPFPPEVIAPMRALRGETVPSFTARVQRGSGEVIWLSLGSAPMVTSTGEQIGAVTVLTDITRRKVAQDELREAKERLEEEDRRKSEFLAVLSHELRNPLAPIRNSIYLLDRAQPGSEVGARARAVLHRQTDHLVRLIEDLLDVTRIARGKIEVHRTRFDLRDVARKTCDDHRDTFKRAAIEMRLNLPPGPVWVDADATRIAQVIGNLLHNAAKFTPSGGRVQVTVSAGGGSAELSVRDTGIGIEPKDAARLFEPFTQGPQGLARSTGGLGLGLALVQGLVELHGGDVRVVSEGIGKGSEFTVTLPLAQVGEEERAPAAQLPSDSHVVLVIEDNPDTRQTLADLLAFQGHRVHVAQDARAGLKLAHEVRPDVVLCDIGLPDLDGYEVARSMRSEQVFRTTRLIALSGYAQPEDRKRAREAGFDLHIAKPPLPDDLMRALAT